MHRYTHFISLPVVGSAGRSVAAAAADVRRHLACADDRVHVVRDARLHITLGMLSLANADAVREAAAKLQQAKGRPSPLICIRGASSFSRRVAYLNVDKAAETAAELPALRQMIATILKLQHGGWTPHRCSSPRRSLRMR
eukprot:TRINITY_DN15301_c0_g3_i1.p3 TRINITY_DN15301_c0_g3~~TRINITY_DN15301_c0_g3_i1.p3  ORF type:complete len:140 (+),score=26.02 TRINITY_DN15301_c0_g3_i1:29-448(+)